MIERRKERRKKEVNRISIEYLPEGPIYRTKKVNFGLTEDLSLSGLRILTDKFFPIDKVMKISLCLGRSYETIYLIGKVKWVKSLDDEAYNLGLEVVDTFEKSVRTLTGHLYGKTN
ncbi:MAG: PilZ domain-containing protein [Candidatus Aminicenantes bacterium]|nr:MAG: PilZ domain-containing protein [Candidatus Aminicenantes bacterium]